MTPHQSDANNIHIMPADEMQPQNQPTQMFWRAKSKLSLTPNGTLQPQMISQAEK
jgi:hypothetical protein